MFIRICLDNAKLDLSTEDKEPLCQTVAILIVELVKRSA